jgi:acyl-CoA thioester hydrolase
MTAQIFSEYQTDIKPEWIDFNAHLNDAAYALVLSQANELFFASIDLSESYRRTTGASPYTVDLHIAYRSEVKSDELLRAHSRIIELSPKKIRVHTELIKRDGTVAAVGTVLYLHYDSKVGAVTPMPDAQLALAQAWLNPLEG